MRMSKEFGHLYLILFVSPCFRPCLSDTTCATKSCACRFNWWRYFSHLGTPCVSLYHESIWCLIISAVISQVAVSLIKCWVSHRSAQEKPPFLIFSFLLSSLSFLYVNCSTSSDSCQFLQSIHFPIQVQYISSLRIAEASLHNDLLWTRLGSVFTRVRRVFVVYSHLSSLSCGRCRNGCLFLLSLSVYVSTESGLQHNMKVFFFTSSVSYLSVTFLQMQHFRMTSREFSQNWYKCPLGLKEELIGFWWFGVKGQDYWPWKNLKKKTAMQQL